MEKLLNGIPFQYSMISSIAMDLDSLPWFEMEYTFVRSSGPGGQNVNKVNSKAMLRWNLLQSSWFARLPESFQAQVLNRLANQLTSLGELIVTSDRFRDQPKNREDCREKLLSLISSALHRPKARKKTKPSKSSQRRAKENKSRHSDKKRMRSGRYD